MDKIIKRSFINFCKKNKIKILKDYDYGKIRGYKTSGIVSFYLETDSKDKVRTTLQKAKELKIKTIFCSGGSNILINNSFTGLFVFYNRKLIRIIDETTEDMSIAVDAGIKKQELVNFCIESSLEGLEFWSGIPGYVGGGTSMNAGAYGFSIGDYIDSVEILDNGKEKTLSKEELIFNYRKTNIPKTACITSINLKLKKGDQAKIKTQSDNYKNDRKVKHPLYYPSCGSVFKNPEGHYAWKLVKDAGLSGLNYNGVKVSLMHTNFIVTTGSNQTKGEDVIYLIQYIKKAIKDKFNINIEEEVRIY